MLYSDVMVSGKDEKLIPLKQGLKQANSGGKNPTSEDEKLIPLKQGLKQG